MSQALKRNERMECQNLINGLPGVISSKIIESSDGTISDVHVLISKDRHPKQISKDVQTVLATHLNSTVDYRCISIAQTGIKNLQEEERIYFKSVHTKIEDGTLTVEVELTRNDACFKAQVKGFNTRKNADQITIQATLDCLEMMINTDEQLMIEDVDQVSLAKNSVIVVAINLVNRFAEEVLIGSAMLRDDRKESLVRATLDAINRKISILT